MKWSRETIAVGGSLPPNSTYYVVAIVDGEVAGSTELRNSYNDSLNFDGEMIPLEQRLNGEHKVRAVIFEDTNSDGKIVINQDAACKTEDKLIQSGYYMINFSAF